MQRCDIYLRTQKSRIINIVGDSILKDIKSHLMRRNLAVNEKLYINCHRDATLEDMKDYVRPPIKKNADLIVLHTATNDLFSKKSAKKHCE